jgi:Ca-activated chloride channel family protein
MLLIIVPLLILWYIFIYNKSTTAIGFSALQGWEKYKPSVRQRFRHVPFIIRVLIVIILIVVLSRPQKSFDKSEIKVEGIDIMLTVDISGSMLAGDFKPNRLEASKQVAMDFINGRPDDRIGLTIFSSEAFMQCPLTIDHAVLNSFFSEIQNGMIADGTAIGDALGLSVAHIKDSKAISKVIILLTDGVNNCGSLDPLTSAEIAKKYGIRIYTIGVGTHGYAPMPFPSAFGVVYQNVEVNIDENLLTKVAGTTGGKYFRATDNNKLKQIFSEIDKLEKSKIDVTKLNNKQDKYFVLCLMALSLLIIEMMLRFTVFKKIP